jgi:hypothetical protein
LGTIRTRVRALNRWQPFRSRLSRSNRSQCKRRCRAKRVHSRSRPSGPGRRRRLPAPIPSVGIRAQADRAECAERLLYGHAGAFASFDGVRLWDLRDTARSAAARVSGCGKRAG